MRKIVHIDMDAFYASVEQRDDPALRGRPVVVAWKGRRSVVCAASYEARTFGVRSAMPALTAERLCPDAVFVPPDFPRYREVTRQLHAIFRRHTALIEPLSLDEAYLDVTRDLSGLATATASASAIRSAIREETRLTASAGIAPNKFLAKIASDWRKPDGQFVIRPHQVDAFLAPLPVGRLPGVGKVTQARLAALGIASVGDLRGVDARVLQQAFGSYGQRLHELSRGIDERRVVSERPTQSISSEDTFAVDLPLAGLDEAIAQLAAKTWAAAQKETERVGRTVVLKLKTREFRILTRSLTPPQPLANLDQFTRVALDLRARVALPDSTRYRLVGVGLGNFTARDGLAHAGDLFGP
ncbi:DNA polymerase IV [Chiayiivirga flava]|uniref:DNA polymerase IV n=1 Tax=Chiayiivirga flava TaxID=659595 RepID=A0A7W8D6S3_9GAMM|nr:DNA polymerase IV [Chiayiivirga flava]MBB5207318.1 DNA polymerase-4 [Chiayiivirga flava]